MALFIFIVFFGGRSEWRSSGGLQLVSRGGEWGLGPPGGGGGRAVLHHHPHGGPGGLLGADEQFPL